MIDAQLTAVMTVQNRLDSSGRADRHFQNALHLRPLADSETMLCDEAIDCSLL